MNFYRIIFKSESGKVVQDLFCCGNCSRKYKTKPIKDATIQKAVFLSNKENIGETVSKFSKWEFMTFCEHIKELYPHEFI